MKSSKVADPGFILLGIMLAVLVGAGVFFYGKLRVDKFENLIQKEDPAAFLLVISDGEKILYSDIFLYQDSTGKGALVDIPPNTGSLIKEQGKIAAIETLYTPENPAAFMTKVEEISGIHFDYYLVFGISDLENVVDLIGGVETFIANPVETRENGVSVLLPSGSFVMDGSKAGIFIRYGDSGETDTERISRGQNFFQNLLHGIGLNDDMLRNENARKVFAEKVRTDLSSRGIVSFAAAMKRMDAENMVLLRLRGTERTVDDSELIFPHSEGRLLRETLNQTINSLKSENLLSEDDLRVAIEIRNGTEVNGLAGRTSQLYQSFGYDVSRVGNAEGDLEKTVIIDRIGDPQTAKRIADVIQCKNIQIQTDYIEIDEGFEDPMDIIIILGKDFDGRYCKE